ncbi:FG-GAP repeat domain-containing protein [Nonomuraea sp. NPDC049646]|uniref:FG-GAP repeat domain-containing protein n=1 Tax=unclassified Nonomuraea TaxID=2593643 RepID=UPI0037ACD13E
MIGLFSGYVEVGEHPLARSRRRDCEQPLPLDTWNGECDPRRRPVAPAQKEEHVLRSAQRPSKTRRAATILLATVVALASTTPAHATATPTISVRGVTDWDGDGHQDLIAIDSSTGYLWLYPGESRRGYSFQPRVRIGNGWNDFYVRGMTDWDADGHQDILAIQRSTGLLWLYPGESKRGYSSQQPVVIGNGWGGYHIRGLADWDGDGHQDILAQYEGNGLWLYPGESKRGYSNQPRVGVVMAGVLRYIRWVADWDGDGHQDVIGNGTGNDLLILYPGESIRGFSSQPRVQIGNGWQRYVVASVADWDADGHQDIIAINYDTWDLWLYPGESKRGYSSQQPVKIGNGWIG